MTAKNDFKNNMREIRTQLLKFDQADFEKVNLLMEQNKSLLKDIERQDLREFLKKEYHEMKNMIKIVKYSALRN